MRVIALLALLALAACADPARNLYEGIRQHNDAQRTPVERATNPAPSYDAYKKETGSD
ncbi:MAG: hypothetical protein KKA63_00035 [Gammaproteobacteria bacterium]|nr:hypothetical protein [Gammaproteobacteria bacterium]